MTLTLVIAYGVPAYLGLGGLSLILTGLLLLIPSMLVAIVLLFKNIRPKYVARGMSPPSFIRR